MGLGGLKRAGGELRAAALLAPEAGRAMRERGFSKGSYKGSCKGYSSVTTKSYYIGLPHKD